jgi:YD repeat-containing protein
MRAATVLRLVVESGVVGSATDAAPSRAYLSNGVDQVVSLWDGNSNKTAWAYDIFGNPTNKLYADGSQERYHYDRLNRLTNKVDTAGISTGYGYDPNGNLVSIKYGSLSPVTFGYDALNRRTNMVDAVGTTGIRGRSAHSCRMMKSGIVSLLFALLTALTAAASIPLPAFSDFPIVGTSRGAIFQSLEEVAAPKGVIRTFTWGVDLSGTIGGAGGIGGLVGIRSYAAPATNYYVRTDGKGNVTEIRRQNGTVAASYGEGRGQALISDYGQESSLDAHICSLNCDPSEVDRLVPTADAICPTHPAAPGILPRPVA